MGRACSTTCRTSASSTRREPCRYGLDLRRVLEEARRRPGQRRPRTPRASWTLRHPRPAVRGYGILYRYGLFKQLFDNGFQTEHPDPWMERLPFVIHREERARIVSYADGRAPSLRHRDHRLRHQERGHPAPVEGRAQLRFDYDALLPALHQRHRRRERTMVISRVRNTPTATFEGPARAPAVLLLLRFPGRSSRTTCVQVGPDRLRRVQRRPARFVTRSWPFPSSCASSWTSTAWGGSAWAVVSKTFAYEPHDFSRGPRDLGHSHRPTLPAHLSGRAQIDRRFPHRHGRPRPRPGTIDYMRPSPATPCAWRGSPATPRIPSTAWPPPHGRSSSATPSKWYAIWPERFNNKTYSVTPRRWLKAVQPRAWPPSSTGDRTWVRENLTGAVKFTSAGSDAVLERLDRGSSTKEQGWSSRPG